MSVAGAFLRALSPQDQDYFPYRFHGSWTDEEASTIEQAIAEYVPERVGPSYNGWAFSKGSPHYFLAARATWEFGFLEGSTAEALATALTKYYEGE